MSIMGTGAEPRTRRDIALCVLISAARDKSYQKVLRLMSKRVGVALRTQRANGVIEAARGPGQFVLWKVTK